MRLSIVPNNRMKREESKMIPILTPQQIQKLNNLKRISFVQEQSHRKSIKPNMYYPQNNYYQEIQSFHKHNQCPTTAERQNKSPKKYIKQPFKSNQHTSQQSGRKIFANAIKQDEQQQGCCSWFNKRYEQSTKVRSPLRTLKNPNWKS